MVLTHPAHQVYLGIPGYALSWMILISAVSVFIYIMYKRYILVSSGRKVYNALRELRTGR